MPRDQNITRDYMGCCFLTAGHRVKVLEVADAEFPDAQSRPLAMARLGFAHQRSLAHQDIISARQLGAAMSALAEPGDAVHLNLRCAQLYVAYCQFCRKHQKASRSSSNAIGLQHCCAVSALSLEGLDQGQYIQARL
jgi:hypothetical protein